jgi:hypothetical protein
MTISEWQLLLLLLLLLVVVLLVVLWLLLLLLFLCIFSFLLAPPAAIAAAKQLAVSASRTYDTSGIARAGNGGSRSRICQVIISDPSPAVA